MLSAALKAKIREYYEERVKHIRDNNIVNVTTPTYKLVFTKHKGYVGQCHYAKREIRISELLNRSATWECIKDTINHELAHWATPGHSHDVVWQQMAIRLGAMPQTRVAIGDLQRPFIIECRGEVVGYSDVLRTGEDAAGRYIKRRKRETFGNLVYKPNPDYIDNSNWCEPDVDQKKPVKKTNKIIEDFLSDI
ncbi:hypothetical protein 44RRORF238c [Aeromonas phage 44RR2.8t]|uniref:SprT-like domain-containing protein n=2 Tax=Biquartavirus 44RR2 TaxID=115987 RepID=Q6U964_9CAUD|nr:hypothetical protein ST44RRORF238c [Aeromonas phage 44RR2.8t]AAQ81556.1 hypothetical protein 44RRORF238c [Aeromonas phage 44RR2.8t]APU00710.1 hypothetical protein [Aeromonas phage 44RR2.8t.2]